MILTLDGSQSLKKSFSNLLRRLFYNIETGKCDDGNFWAQSYETFRRLFRHLTLLT